MNKGLIFLSIVLLASCSNDWEATEGVVDLECTVDGEKTPSLFFTIDIDNSRVYSRSHKSNTNLTINALHWNFTLHGAVNLSINRQSGRMKLSMNTEFFPNHFLFGECN